MKSAVMFLVLGIIPRLSHAFPEMVRHGYTSCVACHVSPAGGGILNPYGRSIAAELLSRWVYPGEETILHGAVGEKSRSWIDGSRERGMNIGGDLRFLQTRVETSTYKQGRFIPMQRDLEFAIQYDQLTAVVSYGFAFDPRGPDEVELRRGYVLYKVNNNISVRAGNFIPIFGVMLSDHNLSIKQGQRLGLNSARETLEANVLFEKFSGNLSVSQTSDLSVLREEQSATMGANLHLGESSRLGFNYWIGSERGGRRDITGLNMVLGFSKKIYSLSEVDMQVELPDGKDPIRGLRYFQRLGFEFTRGLHAVAQLDGAHSNLEKTSTKFQSPGLGFNFYPRPHWEFQVLWSRPKFEGQSVADSAFVLFHYYL